MRPIPAESHGPGTTRIGAEGGAGWRSLGEITFSFESFGTATGAQPQFERLRGARWRFGTARVLAQVIPLGEDHLRTLVRGFVAHDHAERNHQSLDNKRIAATNNDAAESGRIVRRQCPGGVLSEYHREAA